MKYLIIGDANSMHIFNYVKTVLNTGEYTIYLMTLSTERVREEYRQYYSEHNITLYSLAEEYGGDVPNRTKKQRLSNLIKKLKLIKKIPNCDICHIHSVYKTSVLLYLLQKKKFKHLIASYWGGDIEDKTSFVVKIRKQCFKYADFITVTTQKTLEDFRGIYGDEFNKKLVVCRFATAGIECIHDIFEKKDKLDCKKDLSFPLDKICITCGYSAYAEQHQDLILSKIASLSKEVKDQLFVVVPMQYGRYDQPYIERVYKEAQECGCEYRILEEYYPFEKNAEVAISTDIYIHMRDTDAFSNSLKEQVFAGSTVIIGDWLKYYELEEMQAPFISIETFDELPSTLITLINEERNEDLFEPIYERYSTESVVNQWCDVIKKCR